MTKQVAKGTRPTRKQVRKEADRDNTVKLVTVPERFNDEDAFLRLTGWSKRDKGSHVRYDGHYSTEQHGEIPGFVEVYETRARDGRLIGKDIVAFTYKLPHRVLSYHHRACFPWNEERQAFEVHYQRPPTSIQQAVISTENEIDKI